MVLSQPFYPTYKNINEHQECKPSKFWNLLKAEKGISSEMSRGLNRVHNPEYRCHELREKAVVATHSVIFITWTHSLSGRRHHCLFEHREGVCTCQQLVSNPSPLQSPDHKNTSNSSADVPFLIYLGGPSFIHHSASYHESWLCVDWAGLSVKCKAYLLLLCNDYLPSVCPCVPGIGLGGWF